MLKRIITRILFIIVLICVFALLSACGEKTAALVPPLPTINDETPQPEPSEMITPTPKPAETPTPTADVTPEPSETPSPTAVPEPTLPPDPNMPRLTISDETFPQNMTMYHVAELHGWIRTDKGLITMVWGLLSNSAGEIIQECTYSPNSQSFSLAGTVNAELQFAYLEPDTYTYQVFAVAENKGLVNEQLLIDHSFTVFRSESEMKASSNQESVYYSKQTEDSTQSGQIWNCLIAELDNPFAVAAVMSNIYSESGCDPMRVQGDFSEGFSFSRDYTERVDSGAVSRDEFVYSAPGDSYGVGYGLCQWSGERKANLYDYAKSENKSVGDLEIQCSFIILELSSDYPELLEYLKETDNVKQASSRFCFEYEQAAESRGGNYEDYLNSYAA